MSGLLCIIAHPDDEIFCAGLLLALTSKGIPLHILCVTRGEGGQLGDPPMATRENLGQIREREMQCSARSLKADSLDFLGYVDPLADDGLRTPEHDPATFRDEVAAAMERHRPEVVLTHGSNGDYGHPAHTLTHRIVKSAVAAIGPTSPLMYSFNASFPHPDRQHILNEDDWAHFVIDTSPYNEQKMSALACHVTQWATLFGKRDHHDEYRTAMAEYVRTSSREAYHRHWPPHSDRRPDILETWLDIQPRRHLIRWYVGLLQHRALRHGHRVVRNLKNAVRRTRDRM